MLFGDEPALSEAESFYQRMLAGDPVEAVEQAKAFMAQHSLVDYCDEVARPGLILAQKDVERGVLEDANRKIFHETIDTFSRTSRTSIGSPRRRPMPLRLPP